MEAAIGIEPMDKGFAVHLYPCQRDADTCGSLRIRTHMLQIG